MQHFISYSTALVQMAENVPILSAPVEDILVCCVMHYVVLMDVAGPSNETNRLMKTWREISVCSLQYTEKQTEEPKIERICSGGRGESSVSSLMWIIFIFY